VAIDDAGYDELARGVENLGILRRLDRLPTSAIFPSLIRTEPFSMVPCETVRIVAFSIRITGCASGGLAARAKSGSMNEHKRQSMAVRIRILAGMDGILTVHPL